MKLPLIPVDKANHIIYGAAIFAVAALFLPAVFATGVVLVAAVGRELVGQKFDWLDLAVTLAGAAFVWIT